MESKIYLSFTWNCVYSRDSIIIQRVNLYYFHCSNRKCDLILNLFYMYQHTVHVFNLCRSLKFSYQNRRQPQTMAEAKQIKKPRKLNVSDDYPSMAVEKGERRGSPAINIPILSRSSSSEDISSSVGCYPIISMYNLDK